MNTFCFGVILLVAGIIALVAGIIVLVRISTLQRLSQALSKQVESLRLELSAFKREVRGQGTVEPEPALSAPPAVLAAPTIAVPPAVIAPPPLAPPSVAPPVAPPTVAPPIAAREAAPAAPPPTPPRPARSFDWERLVGVKLFSAIAGIALVLAAVFFLKYSVEHGWLSPTIRATLGLLTGTALLVICEMRVARGYTATANALLGAGIAILYSTLFATHALWHLLPSGVVFALMLGVTAVAVMLSIRRDSVFIALLGLMGGFATPALLSTGENRPIGLFSYLLLLNAGLAWVAFRKNWPLLTIGSLIFTALYQWAWVGKFLSASQLPLAATIFGVFAMAGTSALWLRGAQAKRPAFNRVAMVSAILPLAFAIFGSAVPAYGARYNVLFTFLLLMTAGLAAIAITRGPQWLHALGGLATLLTFIIWSAVSYAPRAFPAVLGWITAFVVLYLAAGLRLKTPAVLTAGILFFMFPLLAALEPRTASPLVLFGTLFILLAMTAAFSIDQRSGHVYFVAALFTILAEGVWSANYLTPDRLSSALLIYGAFALLFLGVPVVARRLGRALEADGTALVVILALGVLFFLTGHSIASGALWGLALLLGVLMAGTFIEASASCRPWLAAIAIVLGWAVLGSWWEAASFAAGVIPALTVVTMFAVVTLLGIMWSDRRDHAAGFAPTAHLVLVGYLFLTFVAAHDQLSFPPWPLFAVLAILTLAIGIAALYLWRGSLVIGATIGSQIVIGVWSASAAVQPWTNLALLATVAVAAYAVVWHGLAHRLSPAREGHFLAAAILGLFTAHIVAMIAGSAPLNPLFVPLLATHAIIAVTVLALAWFTEHHDFVVIEVALAALAMGVARLETPSHEFTFAAILYAMFIAYPLLLGARAKRRFEPYLAAVLASVPFFFFARDAMVDAGLDWGIGILPVGQAILMMILVLRLLGIEQPAQRQLTRLATVAAAALAFITLAIPLQLDKQWITLAWALEGAALVWLFTRIPHRGLLVWATGLLSIVFVRLVLNPEVFSYHPASHLPVLNWYLYTYLVSAIAFFLAAYFWPRDVRAGMAAANVGGTIILFVLLNIEIADFYSKGPNLAFNFLSSSLAQDLTYTIGWALFAVAMLIAGIAFHTRSARVAALLLLVVTILKCFLHDLARLGGLYRVGSLLGLAISLVLAGILLQKFVMSKTASAPEEAV